MLMTRRLFMLAASAFGVTAAIPLQKAFATSQLPKHELTISEMPNHGHQVDPIPSGTRMVFKQETAPCGWTPIRGTSQYLIAQKD